jgi:acyl-CoA synthetase (AMP-forming)/AMP-acid ligase II
MRPHCPHGPLTRTWAELDDRAARFAGAMADAGVGAGSDDGGAKVGMALYNGPAYTEATFGAFKARAVPFNVNYRYRESELAYLLSNADCEVVVAHPELVDLIEAIRADVPSLRLLVAVGDEIDGSPVGDLPDGWVHYEELLAASDPASPHRAVRRRLVVPLHRRNHRHAQGCDVAPQLAARRVWAHLEGASRWRCPTRRRRRPGSAAELRERGTEQRLIPAAPMMHGTSSQLTMGALSTGGHVVTLTSRSFDPAELWATVEDRSATHLCIVGDPFCRPMVVELETAEATGRPYDLTSLKVITSSGAMWSGPQKEALLARVPALLIDLLGSSEGNGFGASVARRGRSAGTARFQLGDDAAVFTEDGRRVEPGSGERGRLATGGHLPLGYYKDAAATDATYPTYEGRRWAVPGDFATVELDGTINLLGRGSVSINTAGEKVFPEEVEEATKSLAWVVDATVVGVPDETWGSAVTAVVSLGDGAPGDLTPDEALGSDAVGVPADAALLELVRTHVKEQLAAYKAPQHVVVVPAVKRGPNGKADYLWAGEVATSALG